jgi:Family of unknown function (DUF6412)
MARVDGGAYGGWMATRAFAWLIVGLLVLVPAGAPTPAASFAALVIAVVLAWSLVRPASTRTLGVGRRPAVARPVVEPRRSFDPDAAGRPRPRAPGA